MSKRKMQPTEPTRRMTARTITTAMRAVLFEPVDVVPVVPPDSRFEVTSFDARSLRGGEGDADGGGGGLGDAGGSV